MEIPHRTDVKHHPSHLMVRFRDLLLLRDYYVIKQRAEYAHSRARDIYKASSEAVTPVEELGYDDQTMNCAVCQERVVAPCWNCVICYSK
jgi:hypothetical protein